MENLAELHGKLKKNYAPFTDADLLLIECKKEELISRLQVRLGKTKDEVLKLIYDL